MNTNMKNRAKRTIAGFLAALTVITATAPLFTCAAEITEDTQSTVVASVEECIVPDTEEQTTDAPENEEETEKETEAVTEETTEETTEAAPARPSREELINDVLKNIEDKSVEEVLDYWIEYEKQPVKKYGDLLLFPEEAAEQEASLKKAVLKICAKAMSKAIVVAMKSGCGDASAIAEGPVENIVNYMFGIENDASNKQVLKHMDQKTDELTNIMQMMHKNTLNSIKDMTAATQIGGKFNDFDKEANSKALAISAIYSTAVNFKNYPTENDRITAMAALLGSLKDYNCTELERCELNAYTLITKQGNSIDPDGRTLFDLGYSMAANESMFRGEAIDRSEPFIRKNISNYVSNVMVMLSLLNAQTTVSNFTKAEIEALSPAARADYETICEYAADAAGYQRTLILKLADPENGVLRKMEDYLNQENRTVYIGKGIVTPVALSPEFSYVSSKSMYNHDDFTCFDYFNKDVHEKYIKASGLTQAQIKDICNHAAISCKTLDHPTRRGYFEEVGFVFDDSKMKTVRCNHSAIIACETFSNWSRYPFSSGWDGLKGYRVNSTTGYEECGFVWGSTGLMTGNKSQAKGDPFDFLYFQKA